MVRPPPPTNQSVSKACVGGPELGQSVHVLRHPLRSRKRSVSSARTAKVQPPWVQRRYDEARGDHGRAGVLQRHPPYEGRRKISGEENRKDEGRMLDVAGAIVGMGISSQAEGQST